MTRSKRSAASKAGAETATAAESRRSCAASMERANAASVALRAAVALPHAATSSSHSSVRTRMRLPGVAPRHVQGGSARCSASASSQLCSAAPAASVSSSAGSASVSTTSVAPSAEASRPHKPQPAPSSSTFTGGCSRLRGAAASSRASTAHFKVKCKQTRRSLHAAVAGSGESSSLLTWLPPAGGLTCGRAAFPQAAKLASPLPAVAPRPAAAATGAAATAADERSRARRRGATLAVGALTAALLLVGVHSRSRSALREHPLSPGPSACPPLYTSDGYVAPWLPYCPAAAPAAALGGDAPKLAAVPDTRTLRRPAHTALDVRACEATPRFAVVVSAHDAAHVLGRNIEVLLKHTTGLWELIVVLDACRDGSEVAARAALLRGMERAGDVGGLVRARLVVLPDAVWETSSDNLGMQLADARAEWLLLVQADILVGERGWNARLALPGEVWRDVWAISGRAAHNAARGRFEDTPGFNMTAGRDLEAMPSAEALQAAAKRFYIRDALNRGPVALRADVARDLGFFNERDFHLGRDEHELMLRAYVEKGLRCGYYDVGFAMRKGDGASRRKGRKSQRSARDWAYLVYRLARKRRATAAANAVALGKLPHWNEERAVPPDALQQALQVAEQQQSEAACGSARMTIR